MLIACDDGGGAQTRLRSHSHHVTVDAVPTTRTTNHDGAPYVKV